MSSILKKKIDTKKAKIAVIGLGYVGLPLAINFAKAGFEVLGIDSDSSRIEKIRKKQSYILDVPSQQMAKVIQGGKLKPSTNFGILKAADVILICVPTPLKRKYTPKISYMLNAVKVIRRFIKKDTLIVLESTTYPGTTDELIKPELEKSGLKAGEDFYLSFSPERIDPGNRKYDVTRIPKIVGGFGAVDGELTKLLYEKIIKKVHLVSSPKVAEMTKLLENSFRIINIGWINEIAMMCHELGIDVWEVIEAAKTKPFGFMPFYPGLGVGGHCIPEDPLYLYWKAKMQGVNCKFIKLAADINSHMPYYVIDRLRKILRQSKKSFNQSKILVIGVTYKKDVKDLRKSRSLQLVELLKLNKCKVDYFDPFIPYLDINGIYLKSVVLNQKMLAQFDCVVIATDHTQIKYQLILRSARLIFDVRNVYRYIRHNKVIRL